MPLPKRRHSNARTRKRRTHYVLTPPVLAECPRCTAMREAHHVCPKCGYYGTGTRSRKVIEVEAKPAPEEA